MKVVIRSDSSLQIGSGHVMRCLTLADELRQRGDTILFICREHPGNLIGLVEGKGYPVKRLPIEHVAKPEETVHSEWLGTSWEQDAAVTIAVVGGTNPQWLIVDHYALDRRWEEKFRTYVNRIMVIDDLADRPHDCDLLLDQNLYKNMESRYYDLVPVNCKKLLGPKYALLRPEFIEARRNLRERDGRVRHMLIFFGGSDPTNETAKALEAFRSLNRQEIAVDVVVGSLNVRWEEIKSLCTSMRNTIFHRQISNMAELMVLADLAIGAGGGTTWERCAVGLPSIVLTIAENQEATTAVVARTGVLWYLGRSTNVTIEHLAKAIRRALNNPLMLKEMSEKAARKMGSEIFTGNSLLLNEIWGNDNVSS